MDLSNEELVIAFQQGDVPFETVYQQCKFMIFKTSNKWQLRGYDREDIENLAIHAFYEACLQFDHTRGIKFSTHSINHMRYRLREVHERSKLEKHGGTSTFISSDNQMTTKDRKHYEAGLLDCFEEPAQATELACCLDVVKATIEGLKEPQQTILKRYLFNQEEQYLIAKDLNTSNARINYHVKEGLKKIQFDLKRAGWSYELMQQS